MSRTRSKSSLWAVVPLAFLVFAGWQAVATFARAPALNGSLLVEAADGGRFPRFLPAMHSYPDYLYEVGYDWRHNPRRGESLIAGGHAASGFTMLSDLYRLRDFVAAGLRAGGDNPKARADARRAREIVTESLRLHPANPKAWILLAQVNDTLGDREAALAAYLASQNLAPYTTAIATMRLGFLERFLEAPGGQDLARSMIDPQIVHTDRRAAGLLGYKQWADSAAIRQFLGEPDTG